MGPAFVRCGLAVSVILLASCAKPTGETETVAAPSADPCFLSVNEAFVGSWELKRTFRDGLGTNTAVFDSTISKSTLPGVIEFRHAERGGAELHGSYTVTATGSDDVTMDSAGTVLDKASGKEIIKCDADPVDGWRLAEVRYESARTNGETSDMLQHIMVSDAAVVVAISVRPVGAATPYEWLETWTGVRKPESPPALAQDLGSCGQDFLRSTVGKWEGSFINRDDNGIVTLAGRTGNSIGDAGEMVITFEWGAAEWGEWNGAKQSVAVDANGVVQERTVSTARKELQKTEGQVTRCDPAPPSPDQPRVMQITFQPTVDGKPAVWLSHLQRLGDTLVFNNTTKPEDAMGFYWGQTVALKQVK